MEKNHRLGESPARQKNRLLRPEAAEGKKEEGEIAFLCERRGGLPVWAEEDPLLRFGGERPKEAKIRRAVMYVDARERCGTRRLHH